MKTVIISHRSQTAVATGEGQTPILHALWGLQQAGGITPSEKDKLVFVFADTRSDSETGLRMESEISGLTFTVAKNNG